MKQRVRMNERGYPIRVSTAYHHPPEGYWKRRDRRLQRVFPQHEAHEDTRIDVSRVMAKILLPHEYLVIRMVFGIGVEDRTTLKEASRNFSCTQRDILTVIRRGLKKLSMALVDYAPLDRRPYRLRQGKWLHRLLRGL